MWKFNWWRDKDNRDAASAIVGAMKVLVPAGLVAVAAVIGWFGLSGGGDPKPTPAIVTGDNSPVQTGDGTQIVLGDHGQVVVADPDEVSKAAPAEPIVTMTLAQFEERQRYLRDQVEKELRTAGEEDRARLQAERDELQRRLANLPEAFENAKSRILDLQRQLESLQGDVPEDKLRQARQALLQGEISLADSLFAEVEAMEAQAVSRAAAAAYARGQIAEEQIKWADAARHYQRAARLEPNFLNLLKAQEFTLRAGDYTAAEMLGQQLLDVAQAGKDQRQISTALNSRALTLQALGRFAEAEELFRQALEIDKATIGTSHREYARGLNNLAGMLKAQDRYAEAESLYRQALKVAEATIGVSSRDYAAGLNNLAGVLKAQSHFAEAEQLFRQALEIAKATIGPAHPSYATLLNNLAGAVKVQGRSAEAEVLYRQALEIDRATIGQAHPRYAIHLNNLAEVVQAQGRHAEAEYAFRRALEIDEATIGTSHPRYANHLSDLAGVVQAQGRVAEAIPLYEQALAIFTKRLGPDHPNTVKVRGNLAAARAQ